VNAVAGTNFTVPAVDQTPSFNTTAPHTQWPNKECYASLNHSSSSNNDSLSTSSNGQQQVVVLFCDDFDASDGVVPSGLWQWQRNKTTYDEPAPWNTSFISTWFGNDYGGPSAGNGYAVCVPLAPTSKSATIESRLFALPSTGATLSFSYKGQTLNQGLFTVEYGTVDASAPANGGSGAAAAAAASNGGVVVGEWTVLQSGPLNEGTEWTQASFHLPGSGSATTTTTPTTTTTTMTSVRFSCSAGTAATNFCAVDSVVIA
jgi:hypothetical protein